MYPTFPKDGLDFLRALKRNNKRDWFQPRKDDYERFLRAPMIEFVLALAHDLPPGYIADPAKSIFRIYRDVRFSKDKSPYKTHLAAQFPPRNVPRHGGAGFYFHISPDGCWIGGGFYGPTPQELLAVRNRIAEDHKSLARIVSAPTFKRMFGKLQGSQLTRVPRGFPGEHPAADWLRHKQWYAGAELPASAAAGKTFYATVVKHFAALTPLMQFLNAPFVD